MATNAGHGTDIAFGENTPQPLTDGTAFGWSDGGESENSSFGWTPSGSGAVNKIPFDGNPGADE